MNTSVHCFLKLNIPSKETKLKTHKITYVNPQEYLRCNINKTSFAIKTGCLFES